MLEALIAPALRRKFEFYNFGHALEILTQAYIEEWQELQQCLQHLSLSLADIKRAGGNERVFPKNSMICSIRWVGGKSELPGTCW